MKHDVTIEVDLEDEIADGVVSYIDSYDFSDVIDVDDKIKDLLDQYADSTNPCSLGQSFEKAVSWAIGRQAITEEVPMFISHESIRRTVREELKKILLGACNVVPVQEHIDASTT